MRDATTTKHGAMKTPQRAAPLRLATIAISSALAIASTNAFAQQPPPPPPPGFQQQPQPAAPPGFQQQPQPAAPPGYQLQPGQPPPGYYPPPPGYPYGYGVPPEAMLGPKTMDYEEGEAVPPGYHVDTKLRKGLLIGGAVTFGGLYVVSALLAATLNSANCGETLVSNGSGGFTTSSTCPDSYTALYVPIVGPFITIGTAHSSGPGTVVLLIDGIAQAGGLAMAILGIATRNQELVRNDVSKVHVVPVVTRGMAGIGIAGSL